MANAMDPAVQRLIVQRAVRDGVDPQVALRVAMGEGGVRFGAVGDNGSSFGPFQEHIGGSLGHMTPQQAAAFANSPAGINLAVDGIAKYARGLHGAQGIAAAVRGFERPANPAAEIARDTGMSLSGAAGMSMVRGGFGSSLPGQPADPQRALASMLLSAAQNGGQIDPGALLGLAMQRQQQQAAQTTFGTPGEAVTSGTGAGGIVGTASRYLGVPYKWGGNDPRTGLDCSSFLQQVYAQHGIKLPRTTYDQFKVGQPVGLQQLRPGDAVFTRPGKAGPDHVGLYVGNGQVQESPHTGDVNKVVPLNSFLGDGFVGARRYAP